MDTASGVCWGGKLALFYGAMPIAVHIRNYSSPGPSPYDILFSFCWIIALFLYPVIPCNLCLTAVCGSIALSLEIACTAFVLNGRYYLPLLFLYLYGFHGVCHIFQMLFDYFLAYVTCSHFLHKL